MTAVLVMFACALALQGRVVLRSLQTLDRVRHEIVQEWEEHLPARPYRAEHHRLYVARPSGGRYVRVQQRYKGVPPFVFAGYLVPGLLSAMGVRSFLRRCNPLFQTPYGLSGQRPPLCPSAPLPPTAMLESFVVEFGRYKDTIDRALAQVSDEALNHVPVPDGNSIAMVLRHLAGNLRSRFTDFLTSDGEKPWRDRDQEFETRSYAREEVEQAWREAWAVLEGVLHSLKEEDLARSVRIRGNSLTVHAALARSAAHLAYHAGQVVLLARMHAGPDWAWISIPRGDSARYNENPTKELKPG